MSKVQTSTEFLSLMYLKLPDLFYDMQLTILGIQGGHIRVWPYRSQPRYNILSKKHPFRSGLSTFFHPWTNDQPTQHHITSLALLLSPKCAYSRYVHSSRTDRWWQTHDVASLGHYLSLFYPGHFQLPASFLPVPCPVGWVLFFFSCSSEHILRTI